MHTTKYLLLLIAFVLCGQSHADTIVEIAEQQGFTGLLGALEALGLTSTFNDTNGNFTVFAPANEAFERLGTTDVGHPLSVIVPYHVLPYIVFSTDLINDLVVNDTLAADGTSNYFLRFNNYGGTWYLNGKRVPALKSLFADIKAADIPADNGVIHVIDEVLIPPGPEEQKTIVEEVSSNPNFSTLAQALSEANLTDANLTAYTAFAPTDAAFERLPPGVLSQLLADPISLRQFVLYHLVETTFFTVGLPSGAVLSLQGNPIAIERTPFLKRQAVDPANSTLIVNGVTANPVDLHREDGVIHVLDRVLFPPDLCLPPKSDGGKSLADPSFWCQQISSVLRRRNRCSRYSASDLQSFVDWISNSSSYFSNIRTLSAARSVVCGSSSSLDTLTYGLWMNVASANTFLGTFVGDFCDTTRTSSWYKKRNYKYHCTKFYYNPTNSTTNYDASTINDALDAAERALVSRNRTLRSQYITYFRNLNVKQAPGAGGCPNTCGASASAARAIAETVSFYEESTPASTGMSAGVAAVIGSVVTAVVVIVVVAVLMLLMRESVVNLLSSPKFN